MKKINLTRGYVALVDDTDFFELSKHKWYVNKQKSTDYANRQVIIGGKHTCIQMHRVILNAPKGQHVDHIDGNGLNNQKANLRLCSQSQNLWNQRKRTGDYSSIYKGVTRFRGKWNVSINANGVTHRLGSYSCEKTAAKEYDKLARLLHGEFAVLNFPDKTES